MYCAACAVKNCCTKMGQEGEYPKGCPSTLGKNEDFIKEYYADELDLMIAQKSSNTSQDHSEGRVAKTIRFAQHCGFKKVGLAFCKTLSEEARVVNLLLKRAGFEVESICCKVGHSPREAIGGVPSQNPMCNPIAQAMLLDEAGCELNILLGLCVGHDTLFIRHSKAPVTVLAAKDHVYDNAPMEYVKAQPEYKK